MTEEKRVEDVENTAVEADAAPSSSQQSTQSTASTATVSNKRQRSILDMFSSQDSGSDSKPAVKKTKIANGTAKITAGAAGQLEPLNSIPFSLTEYIESVPVEDRKFLELECECMGKSWCVCRTSGRVSCCCPEQPPDIPSHSQAQAIKRRD